MRPTKVLVTRFYYKVSWIKGCTAAAQPNWPPWVSKKLTTSPWPPIVASISGVRLFTSRCSKHSPPAISRIILTAGSEPDNTKCIVSYHTLYYQTCSRIQHEIYSTEYYAWRTSATGNIQVRDLAQQQCALQSFHCHHVAMPTDCSALSTDNITYIALQLLRMP